MTSPSDRQVITTPGFAKSPAGQIDAGLSMVNPLISPGAVQLGDANNQPDARRTA
jgi:hypothetical protein